MCIVVLFPLFEPIRETWSCRSITNLRRFDGLERDPDEGLDK